MNKIIGTLKTYPFNETVVEEFYDFFKLYKCGIENIHKNIRYYPMEAKDLMGVYLKVEDGNLVSYTARLPHVTNLYSALMYIHESIHCLELENKLNEPYSSSIYDEVLPVLFEGLFVNFLCANKGYNLTDIYGQYQEYRKRKIENIDNEKKQAYVNAYLLQEQLMDDFKENPNAFLKKMRNILKNKTTLEKYFEDSIVNEKVKTHVL